MATCTCLTESKATKRMYALGNFCVHSFTSLMTWPATQRCISGQCKGGESSSVSMQLSEMIPMIICTNRQAHATKYVGTLAVQQSNRAMIDTAVTPTWTRQQNYLAEQACCSSVQLPV